MNLSTIILTFSTMITFVPLDRAQILSNVNRTRQHGPFTGGHVRLKRSPVSSSSSVLPRPTKWEALFGVLQKKSKSRRNARFYLYTRQNPDTGQEMCIDGDEYNRRTNFNPNRRTIFLINGWLDNRFFGKWVREAIRRLLVRGDYNVIYVGWRSIKELFVAAILIHMYSDELAEFIDFIKNSYGVSGQSIHCIGHSLGSFFCAFAGDRTYIDRVTVLDAGPRPWFEEKPLHKRINRFQAGFVDVIHSDFNPTFSLGLTIPLGDVDFYPNGGTIQTGCMRDKWFQSVNELRDEGALTSLFQLPRYLFFCSHYRSHEWFFESILNDRCQFVGVLCPSYQMFIDGECGCEDIRSAGHAESTCALMGYDAEYAILKQKVTKYSPQGRWFIKTSDFLETTNLHCQYQYQLVIKLGKFMAHGHNNSFSVTIVADDGGRNRPVRLVTQELVHPRQYGLVPGYHVAKLMLRPEALPLAKISAIYLSSIPSNSANGRAKWRPTITVEWVKIAPIHIVHNSPIFFCHLEHYLQEGRTNLLRRCPSS